MKVLSISNIKGGVAKTTTAANIAAGLNQRGYRVLMIDSDPQTNLTMCFMDEPEDGELTLYHLYRSALLREEKTIEELKRTIRDGLDIVPGDFELCSADLDFSGKAVGCFSWLSRALTKVKDSYDYVIIDTPPNLGFLTLNAFVASDYVLTPLASDIFSMKAIRLLKRTIDSVSEDVDRELRVIGIVLTRYEEQTKIAKAMETNVLRAAELLNTKAFRTRIRKAVAVQESQLAQMDLFHYAPKAEVTKDYDELVNELVERM